MIYDYVNQTIVKTISFRFENNTKTRIRYRQ